MYTRWSFDITIWIFSNTNRTFEKLYKVKIYKGALPDLMRLTNINK